MDNLPQDVQHVLKCFEDMGACQDDLEKERDKLMSNREYCMVWCRATGFPGYR